MLTLLLRIVRCNGFIRGQRLNGPVLRLQADAADDRSISSKQIYFDIEVAGTPLGRLAFELHSVVSCLS